MAPEQSIRSYADHSTVVGLASDVSTQLRSWVAASWLAQVPTILGNAFDDTTETSAIAAMLRILTYYTHHSYLYRWLTKEPDPDVIVIDLRETYTVGPLIRVLDQLVEHITPYWRDSTLKRELDRLAALGERAADTRPGRILVTLLEPPEPPDRSDEPDGGADRPANNRDE